MPYYNVLQIHGWGLEDEPDQGSYRFRDPLCDSNTIVFLLCHHRMVEARELLGVSFVRELMPSWRLHPRDIIISQRPHLLTPHTGVSIATFKLWGRAHSVYGTCILHILKKKKKVSNKCLEHFKINTPKTELHFIFFNRKHLRTYNYIYTCV